MISDESAPECNRNLTGLLPGRIAIHTCISRHEGYSYRNNVVVTGHSPLQNAPASAAASAMVVVETPSGISSLWLSLTSAPGQVIRYLAGFTPWDPSGWLVHAGTDHTLMVPPSTASYLDACTSAALLSISLAPESHPGSRETNPDRGTNDTVPGNLTITSDAWIDVFTRGEGGYHFYYDPILKATPDGSLIVFADAWKWNESDPQFITPTMSLVTKRSTDTGRTWSSMAILDDPGELHLAYNPAAVVDWTTGRVWVFYILAQPGRDISTARPGTNDIQLLAAWSDDSGATWSDALDLTPVVRDMDDPAWRASFPGPGGAIQTATGRLLVPMWKVPYANFAIYTDDHGSTWQRGQPVPDFENGCENQLVELADGRILMDIRQNEGPSRWMAESTDGGETWSDPWPSQNVTPVRTAIERFSFPEDLGEQDMILWTGPTGFPVMTEAGADPLARWILTMRVSLDSGRTYPFEQQIYENAASYSDLAILGDNTVGLAWERGEQAPDEFITFARFRFSPGPGA
jgi:sialidase-1